MPDLSGRLTKWAVELSEYDISFQPRTSIKSQALADFVADFSPKANMEADKEALCLENGSDQQTEASWKLAVDGSSTSKGCGLGVVLTKSTGEVIQRVVRCDFKATNNETEYEAMIVGLDLAIEIEAKNIEVISYSQLVVNQLSGVYLAKDSRMSIYVEAVKERAKSFNTFSVSQIPRAENNHADALANIGSSLQVKKDINIPVVYMQWPAVWKGAEHPTNHVNRVTSIQWPTVWKELEEIYEVNDESWMTPILDYLLNSTLPEDKYESRKLKIKAARFTIYNNRLYKRSFSGPLLRCLSPKEAKYVMIELHEGECGNHSGSRSLCNKILTIGYYWPTMRMDTYEFINKCDKCQRFAQISHMPPEKLHSTLIPWPFMKWGMDIVGKMPVAPGQRVFMLAVTDYFTKWVEAEAFARVRDKEVKSFIWKNVICRFGVPKEIVTDNGSQFISTNFQDFCKEWGIRLSFSTPRYPQANGQAESTNKSIVSTLKKWLDKEKGCWADELPGVLWAYRTSAKTSTGETPFSLAYGTEVVIPAEVGLLTARTEHITEEDNQQSLQHELGLLDEKREQVLIRVAAYQNQVTRHFNKNIRVRQFNVGSWVLRRVFQNTKEVGVGKLGPNWEGPYQITKVVGQGAYKLQTTDGRDIANSWNVVHLRQYHF